MIKRAYMIAHHIHRGMEGILSPKSTGKLIAETSKDVKINANKIEQVAKMMYECVKKDTYSIKSWKEHELNPKSMDKDAVDWIFLADTLNFSFWSMDEDKKYVVNYGGKQHSGYWSLCAAINRALDEGIPVTNPNFYANVSKEQFAQIMRSDSECDIPLLEERLQILHETGKILLQKYDGSFTNCIGKCDRSAQNLLKLVVTDFPSYEDMAEYNDRKVAFYKRAQILVADIWSCFEGQGYGEFHDIHTITMFADYRIPQALVHFKVMEYSKELMEFLKKNNLMKFGDRYELEIRGCSIWATELIKDETRKLLDSDPATKDALMNSILIDHFLWDYRREHAEEMKDIPFHKIRCIYY
ncbi:hypothetical protein CHS0354_004839 [Potamilus streckersoni]|uniref:Queuosine 5'-phosphate N-glycosylase/hydrolase n=1 Tax=Potamilus streckersoni TaxID=2493646 RepID=A0AAE0VSI5_9BIVA|nr:hypothetical protein CHS0354_004839 [Potamilus streckersoni]